MALDQVAHQLLGQGAVTGAARHIAIADENFRRRIGPRGCLAKTSCTIGVTSHLPQLCKQKLRFGVMRLLGQLCSKRRFGFVVPVQLHQGASTREDQLAMLYAEPCGFVRLHQSFLGALLCAEHGGKSVPCSTVTRRECDRSLESVTRLWDTLHGESRSAQC